MPKNTNLIPQLEEAIAKYSISWKQINDIARFSRYQIDKKTVSYEQIPVQEQQKVNFPENFSKFENLASACISSLENLEKRTDLEAGKPLNYEIMLNILRTTAIITSSPIYVPNLG